MNMPASQGDDDIQLPLDSGESVPGLTTGTEPDYSISINLDTLLALAEKPLSETAKFVAFALSAAELSESEDVRLPGTILAMGGAVPPMAEFRADFSDWLMGLCLRRYIEVYNSFLEKVGELALLAEFQRKPLFEYNSEEVGRRFNDMGLPDKLDRIDEGLEQTVSPILRGMIESINHARNCYEHGRGIVRQRDLHGNEKLVVSWRGAEAFRRTTAGIETLITSLPMVLEPGESLAIKFTDRKQSFSEGEKVSFSPVDASEMGLTFLFHARDLVEAVKITIEAQQS